MPVNLPTNLLRSFVAIVDAGSMLSASHKVFVTQSALSLQIKRLEELLRQNLFLREGRRLSLTPAGELMLDYARKVLVLHDEAVATISAGHFASPTRIGVAQDFAETLLTGLLSQFADHHPGTQIYSRVADTQDLLVQLERGQIDIVLGFAQAADERAIAHTAMAWYGNADLLEQPVLPLAVLEAPCRFRDAALRALERAGIPYRIAVETPHLTALRTAVEAGLGITCRTQLFLTEPPLQAGPMQRRVLPALPRLSCILQTAPRLDIATGQLARLAHQAMAAL